MPIAPSGDEAAFGRSKIRTLNGLHMLEIAATAMSTIEPTLGASDADGGGSRRPNQQHRGRMVGDTHGPGTVKTRFPGRDWRFGICKHGTGIGSFHGARSIASRRCGCQPWRAMIYASKGQELHSAVEIRASSRSGGKRKGTSDRHDLKRRPVAGGAASRHNQRAPEEPARAQQSRYTTGPMAQCQPLLWLATSFPEQLLSKSRSRPDRVSK